MRQFNQNPTIRRQWSCNLLLVVCCLKHCSIRLERVKYVERRSQTVGFISLQLYSPGTKGIEKVFFQSSNNSLEDDHDTNTHHSDKRYLHLCFCFENPCCHKFQRISLSFYALRIIGNNMLCCNFYLECIL